MISILMVLMLWDQKKILDTLSKNIDEKTANSTLVDTSAEHINELLKLRIENVYLKELRRLSLKEETLLKKTARIVSSLREEFKLKDILAVICFLKTTYMY